MKSHLTKIVVFLIVCFLAVSVYASSTYPDIELTKTAYVSSVSPGDLFTYNLYVMNYGYYPAYDVIIHDGLPVGLSLRSYNVLHKSSTIYDVQYIGNGAWIPLDSSLNRRWIIAS